MLLVYTTALYIAYPFIWIASLFSRKLKLWRKGRGHWKKVVSKRNPSAKLIWFHCASVGEFEQARPMIDALYGSDNIQILLTFFSPSGFEFRKDYKNADMVTYLPYDTPSKVSEFLDAFKPGIALIIKYELWFNCIRAIAKRNIPFALVSAHFTKNHWIFSWLGKPFVHELASFDYLFLQDEGSAQQVKNVPGLKYEVVGDTRVDRVLSNKAAGTAYSWIKFFKDLPHTVVAGSLWPEDDELILDALFKHHDLRALVVAHELSASNWQKWKSAFDENEIASVSELEKGRSGNFRIIYVDQMGLLSRLYEMADFAYVGGGFGKAVHNTLEPAVYGIPVIFGPANERFLEVQDLKELGVGIEVNSKSEFNDAITRLISDPTITTDAGIALASYFERQKGAASKVLAWIQQH